MFHCHISQEVHRVELALFVYYVVPNIVATHEDLRALGIAQKLLGLCIGKIECQADRSFPVFADGFKHLEPERRKQGSYRESSGFSASYMKVCAAALKTEGLEIQYLLSVAFVTRLKPQSPSQQTKRR